MLELKKKKNAPTSYGGIYYCCEIEDVVGTPFLQPAVDRAYFRVLYVCDLMRDIIHYYSRRNYKNRVRIHKYSDQLVRKISVRVARLLGERKYLKPRKQADC